MPGAKSQDHSTPLRLLGEEKNTIPFLYKPSQIIDLALQQLQCRVCWDLLSQEPEQSLSDMVKELVLDSQGLGLKV